MNIYDFDETIYDGDSGVDFFLYSLKKCKVNISCIFKAVFKCVGKILGKCETKDAKNELFGYLKNIKDLSGFVEDFWDEHEHKIKKWYLDQKEDSDVIISASPEFLLKPLEKTMHFTVIASKVDKKTGAFTSKNCHDYEKIRRYEELYSKKIEKFYTDSIKADKPMLEYAKEGYIVKGNEITKYH